MKKRLKIVLSRFNFWHLLRLPSLGDVRVLSEASSETLRLQKELKTSIKRLNKKLGALQKAFLAYAAQYADDTMEINARLVRIERQNELAQEATLVALQAEGKTLLNALQAGDDSTSKVMQTNKETILDSLQTNRKTFASGLQFLEKLVKEKAASLEKIHNEILRLRKSVSSSVDKYEVLAEHVEEMYETITEAISKSTNNVVSTNKDFQAQLKKYVDECAKQTNVHLAIERHCAEAEQHCGQVELHCAETEQLCAELMNYLRLLIIESVANDVERSEEIMNKRVSYSLKTGTV